MGICCVTTCACTVAKPRLYRRSLRFRCPCLRLQQHLQSSISRHDTPTPLDATITMKSIEESCASVSVGFGISSRLTVAPNGITAFRTLSLFIASLILSSVNNAAIRCASLATGWTAFGCTTVSK